VGNAIFAWKICIRNEIEEQKKKKKTLFDMLLGMAWNVDISGSGNFLEFILAVFGPNVSFFCEGYSGSRWRDRASVGQEKF
jgi:hypothetical protein